MLTTTKSMRLHIGLYGRTNVGKSSFLNLITGQDISITSPIAGTTTDIVEKAMELLPVGPVLFIDTGGIDDSSELSEKRIAKTEKAFERTDIGVIITDNLNWGEWEEKIFQKLNSKKIPVIIIINKADLLPEGIDLSFYKSKTENILLCSANSAVNREKYISGFKELVLKLCPEEFLNPPPMLGDLAKPGELVILIVPIDTQAPKGRLILPQVQAIRDGLDYNLNVTITKENTYSELVEKLAVKPALVVCDSQVVDIMVNKTPKEVMCTTFSILMARLKGDLPYLIKSTEALDRLENGDKVLIAESCTHHPLKDDIGRIKIPKWIKESLDKNVKIEVCAGKDFPEDLSPYKIIIHCGSCMLGRREMLSRIERARSFNVPLTNYGLCISRLKGVLQRVTEPFRNIV